MNILHMKYVVSIADHGSINQAAEELHVAQPNLSRVIREMEADLGIQFFRRSSKGMSFGSFPLFICVASRGSLLHLLCAGFGPLSGKLYAVGPSLLPDLFFKCCPDLIGLPVFAHFLVAEPF